jgi:hypothetical protein
MYETLCPASIALAEQELILKTKIIFHDRAKKSNDSATMFICAQNTREMLLDIHVSKELSLNFSAFAQSVAMQVLQDKNWDISVEHLVLKNGRTFTHLKTCEQLRKALYTVPLNDTLEIHVMDKKVARANFKNHAATSAKGARNSIVFGVSNVLCSCS